MHSVFPLQNNFCAECYEPDLGISVLHKVRMERLWRGKRNTQAAFIGYSLLILNTCYASGALSTGSFECTVKTRPLFEPEQGR